MRAVWSLASTVLEALGGSELPADKDLNVFAAEDWFRCLPPATTGAAAAASLVSSGAGWGAPQASSSRRTMRTG